MRKRLMKNLLVIVLLSVLMVLVLGMAVFYNDQAQRADMQLSDEADFVANSLMNTDDPVAYLKTVDPNPGYGGRITYYAADGTILYDTYGMAGGPDDFAAQPELRDARETGSGKSTRYSENHGSYSMFHARRLDDKSIVRLALPLQHVFDLMLSILPATLVVAVVAILVCALIARRMTKKIVLPINALNLDDPLSNDVYDEMVPLLARLDLQRKQIQENMRQLAQKQREFDAIIDNISEGLLVLDANENVVSISDSALKIFQVKREDVMGRNIRYCDDSPTVQNLMTRARGGNYSDAFYVRKQYESEFFIMCNPVKNEGAVAGYILLILDITYARETERMRREFSTNVSHELKTPLTSIAGYAEIIMNGIVKPEDTAGFARRIYDESMLLKELISNIMLLSKLDDKGDAMPFEEVDMLDIVHKACGQRQELAKDKGVELTVTGEHVMLRGIPSLLELTVSNLVENGILYNRPEGKVNVDVHRDAGHVVLTVSDTGIGIPEEHRARVFERFYRVDASRGRYIMGSGLGLAIVKHCVRLHDAELTLESETGVGTTITITFRDLKQAPKLEGPAD